MDGNIILALTGAGFNSGNDLLYRKMAVINRDNSHLPFYFLSSAAAAIIAFFFVILESHGISGIVFQAADIIFGLTIGVLSFFTYILYLTSFSGANTSVSVSIYRMNLVPGILIAVFFMGEIVSFKRSIAIICCLASVYLLGSWKSGKAADKRYLYLSIAACLSGGVLNAVNKIAVTHGADSFNLLFVRFLMVTLLAGIVIINRKSYNFENKTIKYAVFSGLFLMSAIYFILESFKTGDIALVLPVAQLSFTIIVIISWIFLKEKMSVRKISGIILAVLSITLIN
ncbi:MAG: DMT family transporter [Saccharofermentanales bacterium]